MFGKIIKVLVVDDSLLIRQMFSKILSSEPTIEVVATAADVNDAKDKIKKYHPDVITLDIEMPGMDGLTFLKKLMALNPIPVIMASSLTQRGAKEAIMALEYGAVDYIPKTTSTDFDIEDLSHELINKVKAASRVKSLRPIYADNIEHETALKPNVYSDIKFRDDIIFAIGSSTGGVEALRDVLINLPKNFPPIVITQHMPPNFTKSFADRLFKICNMGAKEAENGDVLAKGYIYIAPGGKHLEIIKRANEYACVVKSGEKVSGHIPSVDVLFSSVARNAGDKAFGVMLTGMGKDGSKGMLMMKNEGAYNIGQDERTSIVYGMPKAAFLSGAVDIQLSLDQISKKMIDLAKL